MNDSPVDCQNVSVTESQREPRRPASNDNNQIKNQYVILSEEKRLRFTQSKFYRAKSEVKPRSDSDDGISLRVWVAYHIKCYIDSKATEARYEIPRRLTPCASASLLAQQKFDSAQDDRLTVYLRCFFQKSLTNPLPRVIIKVSHKLNIFGIGLFIFRDNCTYF